MSKATDILNEVGDAKLTYSNPTTERFITDWPSGSHKTLATFRVERNSRGLERAVRITVNPKTGLNNAAKKTTFANLVRFVDGSDGRLYIADLSMSGIITITKGTMDYNHEVIYKDDSRYQEVLQLIGP